MLASFSYWEFLLHTPCCLFFSFSFFLFSFFNLGSFSYTSLVGFIFIWGVSLTHPILSFYVGSFSYTSRAAFIFMQGVFSYTCWFYFYARRFSYTSRAGLVFLSGEFLLHISCWLFLLIFIFYFIEGVFLTHPVLDSFLSGEFLLYILYWHHFCLGSFSYTSRAGFCFYLGSFCYTSRAGFIFIWDVSLTHPLLASFLSGKFLLHILCWL